MTLRRPHLAVVGLAVAGLLAAAAPATALPVTDRVATAVAAPSSVPDVAPEQMAGQPLMFDLGEYTRIPTASGAQFCDPVNNPRAAWPTAGRTWSYYNPVDDVSGLSADLTVTGWERASAAFRAVATDRGQCALLPGYAVERWPGQPRKTHLLLRGPHGNWGAVLLHGPWVVAVAVYDWDGTGGGKEAAMAGALDAESRLP